MKKRDVDIRPYTKEFIKKNRITIFIGILQILFSTLGAIMISWIIKELIDLISGINTNYTLIDLCGFSVLNLIIICISYLLAYFSRPAFVSRAISQYKNFVFDKLTKKEISAFSKEGTSQYISALSNDAATIETNYLNNVFNMANAVFLFISAITMMFLYSPLLTVVSIGISFIPIVMSILTSGKAAKAEDMVSKLNEDYMSALQDSLIGFSVVKSFRAESQIINLFAQKVKEVAKAKERREKVSIIIEMLSSLSGILVQLGVFIIGAYMVVLGKNITAGTVIVFVQLLNYVLQPIGTIPNYWAKIKSSQALIKKLALALDKNTENTGSKEFKNFQNCIDIKNLSFGYEQDKLILKNINYTFEKGKSYAIVGGSGSGKSTLLNMLTA